MDNRYREELDQIRLTDESKEALSHALAARREAPERRSGRRAHRWSRTAVAAAALIAVLVLSVGAAVTVSPVVRNYFGDSAGYQQSAVELGQSVTKNGWTMTLTDCIADDYTLYLGVTLTAPEGTVLDNPDGYGFNQWGNTPYFPELDTAGSGGYHQVDDGNPSDNQISFMFDNSYILTLDDQDQHLNGQTMVVELGELYHNEGWVEGAEEYSYTRIIDCEETWTFRVTLEHPDNTIRLEPNAPVHTLDVDATITQVVVTPLTVFVSIEGDSLKGHHDWVPRNAPDGWYGCVEYQEITLYTADGTAIPMMEGMAGSGCSGGDLDIPEEGYLHLVRRPENGLLDVDNLASISIGGGKIPLT